MKKIILTTLLLITIFSVQAQKDSTHKDSTQKDSAALKQYVIVLNETEIKALLQIVGEVDEKPSVIKEWQTFLIQRTQLINPPPPVTPANKEHPKK